MVLGSPGEVIQYCRRMIEVAEIGGRRREIATYAPYGMPEEKFERLVIKAAKLDSGTTRRLSETRIRTGE